MGKRAQRIPSWPGVIHSNKGRIHLRRPTRDPLTFRLRRSGGPYIPACRQPIQNGSKRMRRFHKCPGSASLCKSRRQWRLDFCCRLYHQFSSNSRWGSFPIEMVPEFEQFGFSHFWQERQLILHSLGHAGLQRRQVHGRSVRGRSQVELLLPTHKNELGGLPSLGRPATVPEEDQRNGKETERKTKKERGQHRTLAVRSSGEDNCGLR
jgi:hypothetical protein